ncbi:MAG TPA: nucleoside 2-deoxyribosyltransferase [Bradyrhizobium sp.]|jgi:nucleoside 2-deoxyribosyltransferase|nr:nucleoside 2-deoxyribosyltransferase [Bradyrhizobium sp.]
MKVYLAGPDVFLQEPVAMSRRKKQICARYGLTGLFPLDVEIDPKADDASIKIFRANQEMMDSANAIIANLTPFRGPSADAGTVYELGYMAGCGKLCLGYSNDPSLYAERVAKSTAVKKSRKQHLIDAAGLTVENFGLADNLMIVHALDLYGCPLVVPRQPPEDIWHDLSSFEACVRLAAEQLAAPASD